MYPQQPLQVSLAKSSWEKQSTILDEETVIVDAQVFPVTPERL
jgi:hypothetical protein